MTSQLDGQSDINMARMITKFRIDCEDVQVIDDVRRSRPSEASVRNFEDKVSRFRTDRADAEPWQVISCFEFTRILISD